MNYTAKTRRTPNPQPELFQLFEEEPGGGRPGSVTYPALSGTLWSKGSRRAPSCRSSMLLCRGVGTSWWKRSGTSICTSPSRISKCPRSRLHPVVLAGAPLLQMAEQLVEVSEFVQLAAVFQQQMVDASGSPQCFLPGKDYFLVWEQNMDIPVPHCHAVGLVGEVFKVHAHDRIQQRFVEQCTLRVQDQFLNFVVEGKSSRFTPRSEFSCFTRTPAWCCG